MSGSRCAALREGIELFPSVYGFAVINMPRPETRLIDQQPVARKPMQKPPLNPDIADTAPSDSALTVYDEEHIITYLRLLDADAAGADWRKVARIVLHIDPERESDRERTRDDADENRFLLEVGSSSDEKPRLQVLADRSAIARRDAN